MPISSDPEARARQIASIKRYAIEPRRKGWRSTKPLRVQLPASLAELFEELDWEDRAAVVMTGLEALASEES